MSRVGVVVIGRNEGERLQACLRSLEGVRPLVYVDSGSSDGSPAAAEALGAAVIALDLARPFTAARARNAGLDALSAECDLVQFVDGDCTIVPGWIDAAVAALAAEAELAAVFGDIAERAPEASRYNWLCDVEWSGEAGIVRQIPGIAMLRRAALEAAGRYPEDMIAGEEPDLSIRLRAQGWKLRRLARPMATHDAALLRFGQWWRRAVRGGHAYAELAARHRGSPLDHFTAKLRRSVLWGGLMIAGVAMLLLAIVVRSSVLAAVGGGALLLTLLQLGRLTLREARDRPLRDAVTLACHLMLAKPAELRGAARYHWSRITGRYSGLIEHK